MINQRGIQRNALINKTKTNAKKGCALLVLFFCIHPFLINPLYANQTATRTSVTKNQLNQIETKMDKLQHHLSNEKNTRSDLYHALASAEKQMSESIHALYTLRLDIEKKQSAIANTQRAIDTERQQLRVQQQILAHHVRARYQMSNVQPMQWLFNPDSPQTIDRLITYYQYIVQADQRLIQKVRETTDSLSKNQEGFRAECASLKQLQHTLLDRQKKLTEAKLKQHNVIQSLNQSIQTKQEALLKYQRDQARLQHLLEVLAQPSPQVKPLQAIASAIRFNAKFSSPLKEKIQRTQPLNQGMLFFAHRGTPVSAVLPGKVVFSDWLNGYGLLLIIDHGQGMMSLYAHNESLFKTKGALVKQGDQIATVGHSGGLQENGLYFELRRRGKVIPPRQWLS